LGYPATSPPDDVGDATRIDHVVRAMTSVNVTMFCVNSPFAIWSGSSQRA
jgi:hypothetical protein